MNGKRKCQRTQDVSDVMPDGIVMLCLRHNDVLR